MPDVCLRQSISHSRSNSGGFRSRRSYNNLQHISLAPLTSRFPLDDDNDDEYGVASKREGDRLPTTSYYSTTSVPATPPVLSDSRTASSTNLARLLKPSKTAPLSDTRLDLLNVQRPAHHRHHQRTQSHNPRHGLPRARTAHDDNEWLLRAGLALATSTREEKGQSWLVKRESSTNLIADINQEPSRSSRPHASRSQTARRYRSGISTPIDLSRRGSKSQLPSPRSSRVSFMAAADGALDFRSGFATPAAYDHADYMPDFVDHAVRAEMRSLMTMSRGSPHFTQVRDGGDHAENDGNNDEEEDAADYNARWLAGFDPRLHPADGSYSGSESSDDESEFGEMEMQRLTREQGFGLGLWVDRLVEWTLFNVEEESSTVADVHWTDDHHDAAAALAAGTLAAKSATIAPMGDNDHDHDHWQSDADTDAQSTGALDDDGCPAAVDPPPPGGLAGGWADVKWLLRAARNAL
ncbi:hypothetical protein LOZ65_003307 [Ophidiomyces ophidiicola]|nr:hypothetical protein LOZ65_003307 [Ophidiomyces ophidiicola]